MVRNSNLSSLPNPKREAGSELGHDHKKTCPADILIDNWGLGGKAAALDTSLNKPEIILEVSVTAVVATENWKLSTSMIMGWECSRLVWYLGRQSYQNLL